MADLVYQWAKETVEGLGWPATAQCVMAVKAVIERECETDPTFTPFGPGLTMNECMNANLQD